MAYRAEAVVTDIEGTTSSIAFVKDVLFPYAAERLPEYLQDHAQAPNVRTQLAAVAEETGIDADDVEALTQQLLEWIAADVKATPLKALQGLVWEHGYRSGAYHAHVYEDAVARLREWHRQGLPLYVYSSGSVKAQKLFFSHTVFGDLSGLFTGYFDTTTGPKGDTASYDRIAESVGVAPERLLFLSDVEAELDAAGAAGLQTVWVLRPEDSPEGLELGRSRHPVAHSFKEIHLVS